LDGDTPTLALDGWNVTVSAAARSSRLVPVFLNTDAQVVGGAPVLLEQSSQ
jgi:hypothetical protein